MSQKKGFLDRVEYAGMLISCICCAMLMVLTNTDIVLRPFHIEFYLANDLNGYLLVMLIVMALPAVTRKDQHVKVKLFVNCFPSCARYFALLQHLLMFLYVTALVLICGYLAYSSGMDQLISQGFLHTPMVYPQSGMVIGLLLMWVVQGQLFVDAARLLFGTGAHAAVTGPQGE